MNESLEEIILPKLKDDEFTNNDLLIIDNEIESIIKDIKSLLSLNKILNSKVFLQELEQINSYKDINQQINILKKLRKEILKSKLDSIFSTREKTEENSDIEVLTISMPIITDIESLNKQNNRILNIKEK